MTSKPAALGPAAGEHEVLDHPGAGVRVEVGDLHHGALGGEPARDRRPDAARGAGDQADLVDEAPGGRARSVP